MPSARESDGNLSAFYLLFVNNPLPMWVFDLETRRFLEVNDAAVSHYGYSRAEFLSMRIEDIRPPEDADKLHDYMAHDRPAFRHAGTWRHRRRNGDIIDVDVTSHNLEFAGRAAVLVVAQDLTDQRRLERQLLQSQKLEAVGQLAGGIAHDFNNLLTTIQGYCELLLESPLMPPALRGDVDEIRHAAVSAATLTKQLLAFSRKQITDPVVLDMNTVIAQMEGMLQRLIGEDVRVLLRLADHLKAVRIDPGQLEQILLNLVVNARDAMPAGGTLTIETATVELDETYASQHLAVVAGEYVMLAVSDTGRGMDASVLAHVFEPFFTTKPVGKGTGLGLATVYGIVKQNRGNVWVYSEPGEGATFKIYFPALSRQALTPSRAATASSMPVGTETILVVEDDARLRTLVRRSLERFGYTLLITANGDEALQTTASHAGPIHLLLTDVVMPGMSGKTLAQRFSQMRPAARVLYCSGYTENAIVHHGVLDPNVAFIQKPFNPVALARKVRELLDAPSGV